MAPDTDSNDHRVEQALKSGRYHVSEAGVVTLLKPRLGEPRVLNARPTTNGYRRLTLYHLGCEINIGVHRLVAISFLGAEAVRGKQIAHLNHDKTDNRIANLRPMTSQEHHDYDRDRHKGAPRKIRGACACCGTTEGYVGNDGRHVTPRRYDGTTFGFAGQICSTCWHRHDHHRRKPRRRSRRAVVL